MASTEPTQHLMPADNLIEGPLKSLQPELSLQAQSNVDVVGWAVGYELVEKPQALLRE